MKKFLQAEMRPLLCDTLTGCHFRHAGELGPDHANPNLREASAADTDLLSHNKPQLQPFRLQYWT